ncbi:hypothetical protein SNEBB_010092 [Seison nebaliae]|nr:hypothetical protein SNEBB_010092 [Seison nebaliae]
MVRDVLENKSIRTEMQLETAYLFSTSRREILKNLSMGNPDRLFGFYNNQNMGVCMTNVILSMMTSSSLLMNLLKCRRGTCATNMQQQMNIIRQLLCGGQNSNQVLLTVQPSEILIRGVCNNYQRKQYNSKYGVAGDYYLLKYYLTNTPPSVHGSEKETCEYLIQQTKSNVAEDISRWHQVLMDLFQLKSIEKLGKDFKYKWYQEIQIYKTILARLL